MSEGKIVAPEGMLIAAMDAAQAHFNGERKNVRLAVEAVLHWLSDNPIVPTDEWILAHANRHPFTFITPMWKEWIKSFIYEWMARGMFLAPEPEPDPELSTGETIEEFCSRHRQIRTAVIKAFRRGQKAGK